MMKYVPCHMRVFPMQLGVHYVDHFAFHLHWLKYLIERLGAQLAVELWQQALREEEDELLTKILSDGWTEAQKENRIDVAERVNALASEIFSAPIEGVSASEAQRIISASPPFSQIVRHFLDLNVEKNISTYDALHLFYHSIARLAETLIEQHGKRGELIAYDAMLYANVVNQTERLPAADYLTGKRARFEKGYEQPDIFTAGLERNIIRGTEKELTWQVLECEWARYFREHHPRVGTIVACSTDHAEYGSYNEKIRLQLTSTIMEGDPLCSFRLYAIDSGDDDTGDD